MAESHFLKPPDLGYNNHKILNPRKMEPEKPNIQNENSVESPVPHANTSNESHTKHNYWNYAKTLAGILFLILVGYLLVTRADTIKTIPLTNENQPENNPVQVNTVMSKIDNSDILENDWRGDDFQLVKGDGTAKYALPEVLKRKLQYDPQASESNDMRGVVTSPYNKNEVIIALNSYPEDDRNYCTATIYNYNLITGNLQEIYSHKSTGEVIPSFNDGKVSISQYLVCPYLDLLGTQGSRLIFMSDNNQNSPGPCWSEWLTTDWGHLSLELSDLQSGLQPYTVPESQLKKAQNDYNQCSEEFNKYLKEEDQRQSDYLKQKQ